MTLGKRILARRARFVSAMAIAGCTKATKPANIAVIEPIDAAVPTPSTVPEPPPVHDAALPPKQGGSAITIPSGVSPETRKRYEQLSERMLDFRKAASDLEKELDAAPRCPGKTCDDFWRETAGKLQDVGSSIMWFHMYCPNKRDETDRFLEVTTRCQEEAREAREALFAKAERLVGGKAKLERYGQQYDMAHPRPCLSFACDKW